MEERIQENRIFYTTIDNNKYKCCMKITHNGLFKSYHNVIVQKLKKVKFLWWTYNIVEWEIDYLIGQDKGIFNYCLDYTYANNDVYYSIDDVKRSVKEAINKHYSDIEYKKQQEIRAKEIKHKTEI
jgi:hypothetical protein